MLICVKCLVIQGFHVPGNVINQMEIMWLNQWVVSHFSMPINHNLKRDWGRWKHHPFMHGFQSYALYVRHYTTANVRWMTFPQLGGRTKDWVNQVWGLPKSKLVTDSNYFCYFILFLLLSYCSLKFTKTMQNVGYIPR